MTAVRPERTWALAAFACLVAIGGSACDTVALISFSEREFQEINTSGFTATSDSCSGILDGKTTLRFVLQADDGTPIRPDETLANTTVSLSPDDISFRDTAVFEVPIVEDDPRTSDPNAPIDEKAPRVEDACSEGMCRQDGMSCGTAPGIPDDAEARRCYRTASVSLEGQIQFDSDTTKNQLFGILFENAGSSQGFLPSEVGQLYPDWDRDGTAEGGDDVVQIRQRASDINRQSRAALAVLINNWGTARQNALDEGRTTSWGLWEFSGTSTADVLSLVDPLTPGDSVWTTQEDIATSSKDEFSPVEGRRANVYMAINHLLDTAYAPSEYEQHEKTLVVYVDGPDDLRDPSHTAQSVIERATELGVRMFIVHLDDEQIPTTQGGSPIHRDDPRYWNETFEGGELPIQTPCDSDAECLNYERCRVPLPYSTQLGGPVDPTLDPMGEKYCMPTRDPEIGRFGPIDDYAVIACETDGGYIYVRDASGIRPRIDWLPFAMDGLWKATTVVDVLENRNVASDDTYHFQTTMSITLGGTERSYDFSQNGEPIATDDGADTRAVLFN